MVSSGSSSVPIFTEHNAEYNDEHNAEYNAEHNAEHNTEYNAEYNTGLSSHMSLSNHLQTLKFEKIL